MRIGLATWRVALIAIGASGCDAVFSRPGPDEVVGDGDAGTVDARPCNPGVFNAPESVTGPISTNTDPTFASETELWTTRTGAGYDMYIHRRTTGTGAFDSGEPSSFNTSGDELDATFTADGKDLLFIRDDRVLEAHRESAMEPFGPAMELAVAASLGIDVSPDGLVLYVADASMALHTASRSARGAPFGETSQIGQMVTFPSVSADGRELFYLREGSIYRQTRASPDASFDATSDQRVLLETGDPDISADSMTLVFTRGGNIMIARRSCQ